MGSSVQPYRENPASSVPAGPIETEPLGAITIPPGGTHRETFRGELLRALEGVELGAHDRRKKARTAGEWGTS